MPETANENMLRLKSDGTTKIIKGKKKPITSGGAEENQGVVPSDAQTGMGDNKTKRQEDI